MVGRVAGLGKWAGRWKDAQLAFGSPLPPRGQKILHILDTQEIAVKGGGGNPRETEEIKGSSHNCSLIWRN